MKQIALFIIFSLTALGLWANGSSENSTEPTTFTMMEQSYTPVREITVTPTDEILAVFESFNIDSYYLLEQTRVEEYNDEKEIIILPAPITQEVNSTLSLILSENRGNVVDLINEELSSHLVRGKIEAAHMTIGSYY
ncbi:MAG: hypothetical protein PQJ60_04605, partial [Spirochaetales bacterium]|nr:hypothetical protein [Spirochaetales bacterium]